MTAFPSANKALSETGKMLEIEWNFLTGPQLPGTVCLFCSFLPLLAKGADEPFVPEEFAVPAELVCERFKLRMLTVDDAVKDYDAVMSSRKRLRGVFAPSDTWPAETLSLRQNLIDLGRHQKEFQRRTSFAYTAVDPDESSVLGCVYIFPSQKREFDAEVYLWVRDSGYDKGLDLVLFDEVKKWIAAQWPFERVACPGREIPWERWNSFE